MSDDRRQALPQQGDAPASRELDAAAADRCRQAAWAAYWLLIALAAGNMTGRILAVNSVDVSRLESYRLKQALDRQKKKLTDQGFEGEVLAEKMARYEGQTRPKLLLQRPFLSGNDRSRWCTIRALIDDRTYAIDQIVTDEIETKRWNTIDMVKHDRSGQPHLYSSKPTLLPTMLAGAYWLIQKCTGWTLADQPYEVVRAMLLIVNVPAMLVLFVLLAHLLERFGTTEWGRLLVMAAATFGTMLTTFSVVLNNHLIAAAAAMVTLFAASKIWYDGRRDWWWFALAGFFAAFTAANELPAVALLGLLGLGLLWKAPRPTLLFGMPAVLVVAAAALGTNYAAHRTVLPPYYYRTQGEDWQTSNWYNYTYQIGKQTKNSYWRTDDESLQRRSQVDRGEASVARYAIHCLIGHHGIFSLTPLWIFSVAGGLAMLVRAREPSLRAAGVLIAAVSLVCLVFYLAQPTENRNFGGTSSGLRQMFWFAPLWLLAMLPAADWSAGGRCRRVLAGVLLAIGVASASFPTWNPWTHPWIARWMDYMEWIEL